MTKKTSDPKTGKLGTAIRPLHIVVDFPWDAGACMGTGAYSETMVRAMALVAPDSKFTLVVPNAARRCIELPNVHYHSLPEVGVRQEGARQVALPAFLHESKADCLFAPATLLPLCRTCPMVATVHDLLYVRHPDYYSPALVDYLKRWANPSLRLADQLVAISAEAKADLTELMGIPESRISIVRQPVRDTFRKPLARPDVERHLRAMGIEGPYLFHVSNLSPHKNVTFALQVFSRFIASHPESEWSFVYAGGGVAPNRPPDLDRIAKQHGIAERVKYAGRVTDDDLKALYQGCDAFLFPSLAEGWGLPVAEARTLGALILASPHVPSAAESQRLKLEEDLWVSALESRNAGRAVPQAISAEESGRSLFRVLAAAAAGKQNSRSAVISQSVKSPPPRALKTERPPGISGCTIIRNGVKLRYPFEESVASYAPICDEIVICWDPTSEDDTEMLVKRIAQRFPNVRLVESAWNMANRADGRELARQTQVAFSHCRFQWTMYVQADEALHERYHDTLRSLAGQSDAAGIAFQRVSFFCELNREIPEHRARGMIRMFRTGSGRSVGDAMHVSVESHGGGILESDVTLFNYSRLGTSEDIISRCTNLHRFYHDDRWLAARDPEVELDIKTIPYPDSHPAPIEKSYRRTVSQIGAALPKISVHVIAQEKDQFGADLLGSCLDALEGYADQIVVVDNGLGNEALSVVLSRRGPLPITFVDGRDVANDFAELRNRALAATSPAMTHVHKIDSDEVYMPGSLRELKDLLRDPSINQANASFVHFMIDPTLVDSIQGKEVVFRKSGSLEWQGAVHEKLGGVSGGRVINGPALFLHFGYCRPQWQTMLKWLRYAIIQGSDLSHYKFEFLDGVRRPWFRDGRTPDTILESRRPRMEAYRNPYPPSVRPWLEGYAQSGLGWREWVNQRAGHTFWSEWQDLVRSKGSWEDTLEEALSRWTGLSPESAKSQGTGRTIVPSSEDRVEKAPERPHLSLVPPLSRFAGQRTDKGEFRRGFSIIIPTWNNLLYLQKAVECIKKFSDFDHEIIVHVNDGSDGTLEWVKKSGFKHTHTLENVGICVAINRITDLCSRDLVMYFNDDMMALPEWDRLLVDYAEAHDIGKLVWLSSTMIEPNGENPSFIAPADYGKDIETYDEERLLQDLPKLRDQKPDQMGTSWAPNLLYREVFDEVGRMSEEFSPGFGSDPDLAKKLWDIGMRHFVGVGKSLVYHFQCKGTGKIPKHLHNDAEGTFYRKHGLTIREFIFGVLRPQSLTPPPLAPTAVATNEEESC